MSEEMTVTKEQRDKLHQLKNYIKELVKRSAMFCL